MIPLIFAQLPRISHPIARRITCLDGAPALIEGRTGIDTVLKCVDIDSKDVWESVIDGG